MGTPSNNYSELRNKIKAEKQAYESSRNAIFRRIYQDTPHFSPEELAIMVERWRRDHPATVECLIPGVDLVTGEQCKKYRGGRIATTMMEENDSPIHVCNRCPNAKAVGAPTVKVGL